MTSKPCRVCQSEDRFPSGSCRPCAKRRALSPDERREYQRKWYAKNKEKHNERRNRWLNSSPAKKRDINRQKDHKKRMAPGKISKGINERLFAEQMGVCTCCGDMLGNNYHLDHIMPIALGGTNEDQNLQLLRAECNMKKGAKHPDEWRKILGHESYEG
jgi:CRISPR/Cas system Type II protein with McrA/HNH and RuvC-like nuclease domain